MASNLCKLQEKLPAKIKKVAELTYNATHMCGKCGRTSNEKNRLCKPILFTEIFK